MTQKNTYALLASLGAVPFVAAALMGLMGVDHVPTIGDVRLATSIYGLSIVAFLAGSHWAAQLHHGARSRCNLFFVSNAVLLMVVAAALFLPVRFALLVHAMALIGLLLVDEQLGRDRILSVPYLRVRRGATAAASLSILIAAFCG